MYANLILRAARAIYLVAVLFSLLSYGQLVAAVEQQLESEIELATDNDSNARMVSDEDKAIKLQGYSLSPRIKYSAKTERVSFGAVADVELERFDNDDFNANNADIALNLGYQLSEQSNVSTGLGFVRSPTRIEEISDSGSILAGDVETFSWTSSFQHLLSQRQMASATINVSSVNYSNDFYTDRQSSELSAMWRFQWTEKFSVALIPSYSYVDFDTQAYNPVGLSGLAEYIYASTGFGNVIDDSQTASAPVQVIYQFTERLEVSAYAGISFQKLRYLDISCIDSVFFRPYSCRTTTPQKTISVNEYNDNSRVFNVNSSYQYSEKTKLLFNATRQYQPSSEGDLQEVDSILVSYRGKLAERHDLQLSLDWGQSNKPAKENVKDDYQYYKASVRYYYRFARSWKASVNYSFRKNQRDTLSGSNRASGQLWGLGVVYTPNKFLL